MQTITLPEINLPDQTVETPQGKLIYPGWQVPARMMVIDPVEIQSLIKAAREAASVAYSAYSVQFPVGAALVMADDPDQRIFASGNSENSVLNSGICAERAALNYAAGQGFNRLRIIVVSTAHRDKADITLRSPCGLCRQTIREFADDNTIIVIDHDMPGVLANILDINRLLPYGYHYTPMAM
jgi:cytidine deaminase